MKRGRPVGSRNLPSDSLTIPKRVAKEIVVISAQSGMAPQQVLLDILDGGLINAREMYRTLIEYRKSLREQLDDDGRESAEVLSRRELEKGVGSNGNGLHDHTVDGGSLGDDSLHNLRSGEDRPNADAIGPGHEPEVEAAIAGDGGTLES